LHIALLAWSTHALPLQNELGGGGGHRTPLPLSQHSPSLPVPHTMPLPTFVVPWWRSRRCVDVTRLDVCLLFLPVAEHITVVRCLVSPLLLLLALPPPGSWNGGLQRS
jgi:hypothetical protein